MSEEIIKGYKATDANIKCRDYQFTVGEWHKHEGEVVLCKSGFHFCAYPSGPWCYYGDEGVRIWEVEAKGVIQDNEPGADLKYVAKEIRLVREIIPTGSRNTGYFNTGNCNTGDYNSGNRNTGERNTGDYNLTSGSSGFFEIEEPCVSCFGKQTEFKKREFALRFGSSMHSLYNDMKENLDATELAKKYSEIPGVSIEAIEKWKAKYKQLHGAKQ